MTIVDTYVWGLLCAPRVVSTRTFRWRWMARLYCLGFVSMGGTICWAQIRENA